MTTLIKLSNHLALILPGPGDSAAQVQLAVSNHIDILNRIRCSYPEVENFPLWFILMVTRHRTVLLFFSRAIVGNGR